MKMFLQILNSKILLYIIMALLVFGVFKINSCSNEKNESLDTYNRQLQGRLDEREKEIQRLNINLGVSESELITQKKLNDIIKTRQEEKDKSDWNGF